MERNKIYFKDFLTDDHTASFDAAMEYLRGHPNTTLVIEPGTYTLTSPLARETQRAAMAGEYGDDPSEVMFRPNFPYTRGISFAGQRGTRVEGYGVTLMVDGFMEPVSVRDCEDVELCGITIDHKRKPYSHGVIKDVGELDEDGCRHCMIELDPECPIEEETPIGLRSNYFDPAIYRNVYAYIEDRELIDPHHMKCVLARAEAIHDGVQYHTVHTYHSRPAILIENAKRVRLTDVTIHSQPGMGVVGNRSEDVTLSHLCIVPSVGHHMATNTDGTHFTSMKGLLRVENCVFEGQGDDFINVHAYYQDVVERISDTEFYMQEKTPDGTHAQSLDYPDVGDTLELSEKDTMLLLDTYRVLECTPLPDQWRCRVKVDHPLPENTEGLILADVTRLPRLEVVNCSARSHFARGIMLKTRNVLIENNIFHDIDANAIFMAPEAGWYEGVAPENVVIRGNRIVKCGLLGEVRGAIVALADTENPKGQCLRSITIEDNIIDCPDAEFGIYVRNVDGVRIARNRILCGGEAVKVENCTNVSLD